MKCKFLKAVVVTKSQAWTKDNDSSDTSLYIILSSLRSSWGSVHRLVILNLLPGASFAWQRFLLRHVSISLTLICCAVRRIKEAVLLSTTLLQLPLALWRFAAHFQSKEDGGIFEWCLRSLRQVSLCMWYSFAPPSCHWSLAGHWWHVRSV